MKTLFIVLMLIITINIVLVTAQPNWAKKGVYVEYKVKISVTKTDLSSSLGRLDKILSGYTEAVIKYVIVDFNHEIFILNEIVEKVTQGTGGPGNLLYLHIVSQGQANTIKTKEGCQLVYNWYFKYRGVSFPEIREKPYPSNLYVYMDVTQNPKKIASSNTRTIIYSTMSIDINEYVRAEYDESTGFLNKLEYIQAFLVNNINAIVVSVTVTRIGSNISVFFGRAWDIDTLLAVIAGSIVAGIVAVIVFYQRVKKEMGY